MEQRPRIYGKSSQSQLDGMTVLLPQKPEILCFTTTGALPTARNILRIRHTLTDFVISSPYRDALSSGTTQYRQALNAGFELVRSTRILTTNHILKVQQELEWNDAGFRQLPATTLKDASGRVVYTPPQGAGEVVQLMTGLERFINDESTAIDPLIRMALINHQFESIHPFDGGNGRTGRMLNVLYLVKENLLESPVLYMSATSRATSRGITNCCWP